MNFKIDTKEKFTTITVEETNINAIVSERLTELCSTYLEQDVKNIILNLSLVVSVDEFAANNLAKLQHEFYEKHASFVICHVKAPIEKAFDELELLEFMNLTPTESEAWDIVQMEEIERELLDDDEVEFEIEKD